MADNTPALNSSADLIARTKAYVTVYFQNPKFDASHDINHILRVRENAQLILDKEQILRRSKSLPALNPFWGGSEVVRVLKDFGASENLAIVVHTIAEGVSYSTEIKYPQKLSRLIEQIPELAVVQDADRLDAIGAIGIGRCFTYGGAKSIRSLERSVDHFEEKLVKLEGMMKTETGRSMAKERTRRIREFMSWWREEAGPASGSSQP